MVRTILSILTVAAIISGCSVLPTSEPHEIYHIQHKAESLTNATSSQAHPVRDVSVRVATPYSSRLLSNNRILIQPGNGANIQAYPGVRWADTTPVMLRDYIVDSLRTTGYFKSVAQEGARVIAELRLESDLNSFEVRRTNNQVIAYVQLDVSLVSLNGLNVIATNRLQASAPADSTDVDDVVQAFHAAVAELSQQLNEWLYASTGQVG